MAYPLTNDAVIEYTINGQHNGQTVLSVLHFRLQLISAISNGRAFIAEFVTKELAKGPETILATYLNCLSSDYLLNQIVAQAIAPSRYARVVGVPSAATQGNQDVGSLPSSVAAAITKRSDGVAGKHGHGTLHMPAVPTTFVESSILTAAGVTQYQLLGDVLSTDYAVNTSGTLRPVIYDRASPLTSAIYTDASPELTTRTMRRRVVGRGI